LNGALVDLTVMQAFTETLRVAPQSSSNQLIEVDGGQPRNGDNGPKGEHLVLMGNRKWIKEKNFIEISPALESRLIAQEQLGHTAILAAIDGEKLN
jgi:hypothetical protein